ncbi:hypothetical protein BN1708_013218, partial [Verticillium longisporum]
MLESKGSLFSDERVWYDQFTSTDWVHDNIADAHRLKALRSRKDFRGRVHAFFDASQGWLLSFVCGVIIALIAYTITAQAAGYYYANPELRPNLPYRQFNTWMGDPARALLFRAILSEVRAHNLVERTAQVGAHLFAGLERLAAKYPDQ